MDEIGLKIEKETMRTVKTHEEILTELHQPLDPARVAKRAGTGTMQLSYLPGYDVIENLNRIFGYDGWMSRVVSIEAVAGAKLWRATVQIEVRIGERWLTRGDVGIGVHRSDKSEEIEKAVKEAVTDALKRAARTLGNQFGNCLYDKEAPEHNGFSRPEIASLQEVEAYNALLQKARELGLKRKDGGIVADAAAGMEREVLADLTARVASYIEKHPPIPAVEPSLDEQFEEAVARDEVSYVQ